ncbi:hypothetical protein [Rhizobium sp. BK399]|uniref:hypothetical protein n=1 Tax=Rhizobium sp. BK399 TaxID=2587063 RepID=UPI0016210A17|nr:hypothetical protein [Rhizobium sp. BK399]MBB3540795.1 hypothetical protein [Rhizobium sp. BK399]
MATRKRPVAKLPKEIRRLLRGLKDYTLVVGPIVWQPIDDGGRAYYFMVSGCDRAEGFWSVSVHIGREHDEKMQAAFLAMVIKPGRLIQLFDDELDAVSCCDQLWHCAKMQSIKAHLKAERQANP